VGRPRDVNGVDRRHREVLTFGELTPGRSRNLTNALPESLPDFGFPRMFIGQLLLDVVGQEDAEGLLVRIGVVQGPGRDEQEDNEVADELHGALRM